MDFTDIRDFERSGVFMGHDYAVKVHLPDGGVNPFIKEVLIDSTPLFLIPQTEPFETPEHAIEAAIAMAQEHIRAMNG